MFVGQVDLVEVVGGSPVVGGEDGALSPGELARLVGGTPVVGGVQPSVLDRMAGALRAIPTWAWVAGGGLLVFGVLLSSPGGPRIGGGLRPLSASVQFGQRKRR